MHQAFPKNDPERMNSGNFTATETTPSHPDFIPNRGTIEDLRNAIAIKHAIRRLLVAEPPVTKRGRIVREEIRKFLRRGSVLGPDPLRFSVDGQQPLSCVNLRTFISKLESVATQVLGHETTITLFFETDLPAVMTDPDTLERLLIHLLVILHVCMPRETYISICGNVVHDRDGRHQPNRCVRLAVTAESLASEVDLLSPLLYKFFVPKASGGNSAFWLMQRLICELGAGVSLLKDTCGATSLILWLPVA